MKSMTRFTAVALFLALFLALGSGNATAQAQHPGYLHALADLRGARVHLEAPAGGDMRREEKEALRAIDEAIAEIKKASIDDGKDLNDHPPIDAGLDHTGRLHRAKQLLERAHADIAEKEDNVFAQGLRQRAFSNIDKAIHHVDEAMRIVDSHS